MTSYFSSISVILLFHIRVRETIIQAEEIRLTVITSFEELEEVYLRTKMRRPSKGPRESNGSTDPSTKKELCRYIFGSFHFDSTHEIVGEDQPEIRLLLKSEYENMFEGIYKRSQFWPTQRRRTVSCKYCHTRRSWLMMKYEYENAYQTRNIADRSGFNELLEPVFRCITKKRGSQTNEIFEYFVSKEYDVNTLENELYTDYMAARFIFMLSPRNLLVLSALAERTAIIITSGPRNVERLYLFIRKIADSKVSTEDDPLCKMKPFEKLRICTSVLTAVASERGIKFSPDVKSISHDCQNREISFQTDELTRTPNKSMTEFHEWMVACRAKTISDGTAKTFFVSRGYGHNKVFLYREIEDKVYVHNYSGHVNIFDEDGVL